MITRRRLLAIASAVVSLPFWPKSALSSESAPDTDLLDPEDIFLEVKSFGEECHHWVFRSPAEVLEVAGRKEAEGEHELAAFLREAAS